MTTIETEQKQLELPKTKLFVSSGRLVRHSPSNQIMSDIAIHSITHVTAKQEIEWPAIGMLLCSAAGAVACKWFIKSPSLGWAVCVVLGAFAVLLLFGTKKPVLAVRTNDGDVSFDVKETFLEAQAFALSLKQQLTRTK